MRNVTYKEIVDENYEVKQFFSKISDSIIDLFDTSYKGFYVLRLTMIPSLTWNAKLNNEHTDLTPEIMNNEFFKKLQKLLYDTVKGSWLSCSIIYDLEKNNIDFSFNYSHRFNIYKNDWSYEEDDNLISPTRDDFLKHFKNYSRENNHYPSWYKTLLEEEKIISDLVKNSDPKEIFNDVWNIEVDFNGKFYELEKYKIWKDFWGLISEQYSKELISNKVILPYFIDEEKVLGQSEIIYQEIEPKVCSKIIETFVTDSFAEDRAELLKLYYENLDEEPPYYLPDGDESDGEEIDFESLNDDLEFLVKEIVMIQTQQRFPDLES